MFASQVTMESIRVTLASVRDIIDNLLSKGARFVLTSKLNQDPLEVSNMFFNHFHACVVRFIQKVPCHSVFPEVLWCDKELWRLMKAIPP